MTHNLILESDGHLLLKTGTVESREVEKAVQRFAEHIKTLETYEQYYISPLSIWNALAMGISKNKIQRLLQTHMTFDMPIAMEYRLALWFERYDKLVLSTLDSQTCILKGDKKTIDELKKIEQLMALVKDKQETSLSFLLINRGHLKQVLVRANYNVIDECGFQNGEGLSFDLLKHNKLTNVPFELREYQRKAIAAFHRDRIGGNGIIVLPCGTGKTLTGIGVMVSLQCETLIIAPNTISCEQWKEELISKTSLTEEQIGIYAGQKREVKSITIATYHILSYRDNETLECPHMTLFNKRNWGLIVYDEVHLLPAPVFRMTAMIQATRRLGLTATLIREDGCAPDVYSLVGAKLFDYQWKEAEQSKVIAQVHCVQVSVSMNEECYKRYKGLNKREQFKFASTHPSKLEAIASIIRKHKQKQILIIGQYIDQLTSIATVLNIPLVTGQTNHEERQRLFAQFREGHLSILVLSKIANLALNLPNASIAIQVSGSYGSRQEEAQRVGRIVRAKQDENVAVFYSLVCAGTIEEQFAINRGRFLEEQGYIYDTIQAEQLLGRGDQYDNIFNA